MPPVAMVRPKFPNGSSRIRVPVAANVVRTDHSRRKMSIEMLSSLRDDRVRVVSPDWSEQDIAGMRAALAEAELAADAGEIPVGAVVVVNGETIATGHKRSITDNDPSAHAEIIALRGAALVQANYRLNAATLYVTLEPCVMCVGAIVQARVGRVVFGAYDDKAGALGSATDLSDSRALNHRFEINGGLLADESATLLKNFFRTRR